MNTYYTFKDLKLIGQSSKSLIFQGTMDSSSKNSPKQKPKKEPQKNEEIYNKIRKSSDDQIYAIKCIPHEKGHCQKECQDLKNEYFILEMFNHPHIISHYEFYENSENILNQKSGCMTTMEYPKTELKQQQQNKNKKKEKEEKKPFHININQQNIQQIVKKPLSLIQLKRPCISPYVYHNSFHSQNKGENTEKPMIYDLIDLVNSNIYLNSNLDILKSIFKQVLTAIQEIHSKNVTHNDIKLENIVVFQHDLENNDGYLVKLVDFGFASFTYNRTYRGQQEHYLKRNKQKLAPEIIRMVHKFSKFGQLAGIMGIEQEPLDEKKCDMYAVGACMVEFMLRTQICWNPNSLRENDPVYKAFIQQDYEKYWGYFPREKFEIFQDFVVSQNSIQELVYFFDLVQKLICPDIEARLNVNQALEHQFFK